MTPKVTGYINRFNALDSALCLRVNRTSHNLTVRWWFRLMSRLGDGVFWYTLIIVLMLTQGSVGQQAALHMSLTGVIATLMYKWLKGKTLRPRPYEVHQDIWLTGRPLDRFSFPSGHTLHAVTFTWLALCYFPSLAILLIPFSLMVAASRVVLGLHYPSDVLAGALIGGLIASISMLI
jgi:undecaprenyl-diphosphatase